MLARPIECECSAAAVRCTTLLAVALPATVRRAGARRTHRSTTSPKPTTTAAAWPCRRRDRRVRVLAALLASPRRRAATSSTPPATRDRRTRGSRRAASPRPARRRAATSSPPATRSYSTTSSTPTIPIDVDLVAVSRRRILLLGSVEPRAHSGVDRVAEFLISISKNLCELDSDVDIEVDGGAPASRSGPSLDNGS